MKEWRNEVINVNHGKHTGNLKKDARDAIRKGY